MDVYNDICLSWCSELPTDDSLPSLRESLETLIDPSCQREQYEDIEGFNSYDFPRLSIRQLKDALSMISRRPLVQSGAAESHDAISSALTMITKVLATVVYNAKVSNDYKESYVCLEILLTLCSTPGASAYGLVNSNILNILPVIVNQSISLEMNSKGHIKSSGRKLTKTTAPARTNPRAERSSESQDSDEDSGDEESQENATNRERRKSNKGRMDSDDLAALLRQLQKRLFLYTSKRDNSSTTESLVDCLSYGLILATLRSEFGECQELVGDILVKLSLASFDTFTTIIRALMPAIAFAGRDNRLPEGGKQRNQCHNVVIDLSMRILSAFNSSSHLANDWLQSAQSTVLFESKDQEITDSQSAMMIDGPNDEKESDASVDAVDDTDPHELMNKSIIGIIERMILLSPDRAPVRQTILASIQRIVSHILALDRSLSGSPSSSQSYKHPKSIIIHLLRFLCRLCKSTKMTYRAFGLEILVSLLIPSNTGDVSDTLWSDEIYEPVNLLHIIIRRCNDVAPTVRLRALTAVLDILLSLNRQSNPSLASTMLDFALGSRIRNLQPSSAYNSDRSTRISLGGEALRMPNTADARDGVEINLMDVIRGRIFDSKPMIKAKALHGYSVALSMLWPRPDESRLGISGEMPCDEVTMLLTEDDIQLFVAACQDSSSISIRKQGMNALTNLMISRPSDTLLQKAWIGAVLPLIADSETSISQRLLAIVDEIFFDPLVEWMKNLKKGSGVNGRGILLVWQLCGRIASSRKENLLRSCISAKVKQGQITSTSIKPIYKAIWHACSMSDHSIASQDDANNIMGLRSMEPEMICRSGWILLEAFINHPLPNTDKTTSTYLQDINYSDTIVNYYKLKMHSDHIYNIDDDLIRLLKILQQLASSLNPSQRSYLSGEMDRILYLFKYNHPQLLSAALSLRYSMSMSCSDKSQKERYHEVASWCKPLLHRILIILHVFVWNECPDGNEYQTTSLNDADRSNAVWLGQKMQEEGQSSHSMSDLSISTNHHISKPASMATMAIYMLGDIILLGFSSDEDENSFQSAISMEKGKNGSMGFSLSKLSDKLFKMHIPHDMIQLIQLLMGKMFPSSHKRDQIVAIPMEVRGYASVTMGKLCLRSYHLARDSINIYLREIRSNRSNDASSSFMVRNNALLVLSDFCIRYTNLIERHMDTIASCLQDDSMIIRKHALILLSSLILQDYIKFKSQILFRFLSCLLDDNQEFNELAKAIIQRLIAAKYPDFLSSKFSEAIVLFNDCYDHPVLQASANATNQLMAFESHETKPTPTSNQHKEDEEEDIDADTTFHLSGSENSSKRMMIYSFMMEGLTDEQKIQVTAKIVQDILSNALDRGSSKAMSVQEMQVLQDTLQILQSPMLQIARKSHDKDVDLDAEELGNDGQEMSNAMASDGSNKDAAIAKAKIKVLKVLSKQHMINHILPVAMSLKHTLEAQRSSLQGALMDYLVYLMSQHKAEVAEALSSDPILKTELEYDLKNYEKNKERQRLAKEQAAEIAASLTDKTQSVRKSVMKGVNSERRVTIRGPQTIENWAKTIGSSRRLSLRAKDMTPSDDETDNDLDRLISTADENNENQTNRLRGQRWSISVSLPAASQETAIDSNKQETLDHATNDTKVSKRSKKQREANSQGAKAMDSLALLETVSPERKRINLLPSPEAKSKPQKNKTRK